jgi:hypothetical protein
LRRIFWVLFLSLKRFYSVSISKSRHTCKYYGTPNLKRVGGGYMFFSVCGIGPGPTYPGAQPVVVQFRTILNCTVLTES